ncbi:MAG: glutamate/tyrosine decarboxylase-like PLP-dependent enzyme [Bradymonadia bacterium]|jgi:glutamate/tyrosine decarboxylase-like PLP-dependent enzyme
MRLLGLGTNNLISVDTDAHMRMDIAHLGELLDELATAQRPVLAVVGVLGTTEFGTLDPIDKIVATRQEREAAGHGFAVHVDAAWGGYLATLIREPDGGFTPRESVRAEFRYFPSQDVYDALVGVSGADSVTIDPHKLGFIPYPAGAFVTRDRRVAGLLSASAAYVFDNGGDEPVEVEVRDEDLGRYVLEGSKPGSSAASVFATHEVLPLDRQGFGQLLSRTIHSSEWLFDELKELRERLAGVARLEVPIEPDCNVVCLIVNPEGNTSTSVMNTFMRELVEGMRLRPGRSARDLEFMGSFTSIPGDRMLSDDGLRVLTKLGIEQESVPAAGSVFVLRHTLMNPWLLNAASRPLSRYVEFLERRILELLEDPSEPR